MQEYGAYFTTAAGLGLGFLQITWFFSSLYLLNLYLTLFFTPLRVLSHDAAQKSTFRLMLQQRFTMMSFFSRVVGTTGALIFVTKRSAVSA